MLTTAHPPPPPPLSSDIHIPVNDILYERNLTEMLWPNAGLA